MTVVTLSQAPTFPERKGRSETGKSILPPDKARLLKRWNAGCREAWRAVSRPPPPWVTGSCPTVARYARRLRQAQGLQPREPRRGTGLPLVIEGQYKPLTTRAERHE